MLFSVAASPPSDVTAVQDGPTSIILSWTPSSDATGYSIHYTSVSDSGNKVVSDGSTETHTLTGLVNGETYTISVAAISDDLPSESVTAGMAVGLRESLLSQTMVHDIVSAVPGQVMLNEVSTTTATSISLSWSVPTGSVVTQYLVEWQRDTSVGCTDENQDNTTITGGSVRYEIPRLEENSRYMMTVTVSNSAGTSGVSNTVTAMTPVAG